MMLELRNKLRNNYWFIMIWMFVLMICVITLYNVADARQEVIEYYDSYIAHNCYCNTLQEYNTINSGEIEWIKQEQ